MTTHFKNFEGYQPVAMFGHVSQIFSKLGSAHNQKQDAYHQNDDPGAIELFLLSTQKPDDHSLSGLLSFQARTGEHNDISRIHRLRRRFAGWRFAALQFATLAFIVFLINLSVTIWASATHPENGGDLDEGDCGRIKNLNRGLHILINILSTLLLSGSNYCMQCLSAPTRADIDRAHETQRWLDVGIPSIRNLKHIGRSRLCLWLLLGVSSIPLHLLYNSAVYATTSTNDYSAFVVNEEFLNDEECRNCFYTNVSYAMDTSKELQYIWNKSREGSLERLDPMECLTEYATPLQSNRRHVLLVTDDTYNATLVSGLPKTFPLNPNVYSVLDFEATRGIQSTSASGSFSWICSGLSTSEKRCAFALDEVRSAYPPWTVSEYGDGTWSVKYCLSEPAIPRCKLRFSRLIAIIVTMLNLSKTLLMVSVVYVTKSNPLLTMGDAVASFIDKRDVATVNHSMMNMSECRTEYSVNAKPWDGRRWRWKDTTSRKRRYTTLLLYTIALIVVAVLLKWAMQKLSNNGELSAPAIFSLGFGAVDTRAMITPDAFPNDVVVLALVANSPQVVLSFCYFAYNSLFTAMLLGYEWTSYADKRKGLRVSARPKGSQRSTYFLQLPYRFGLPFVILSGTLHWLVSQSIFVVSIDLYDGLGQPISGTGEMGPSQNRCGYSPIAMLAVIVLAAIMVVALIGFGYIPYKSKMPLAASCSLAISAACHPQEQSGPEGGALSEQKLQWGVVSVDQEGIGHCAFSSKEVGPLVKGVMYR